MTRSNDTIADDLFFGTFDEQGGGDENNDNQFFDHTTPDSSDAQILLINGSFISDKWNVLQLKATSNLAHALPHG